MAAEKKRGSDPVSSGSSKGAGGSPRVDAVQAEEALRPFHEAAQRFVQANQSAHESAAREAAQASLEFQDQVREIHQEVYQAVAEANKALLSTVGQEVKGGDEEAHAARSGAQLDYERKVQQTQLDAQSKLAALAEKASRENGEAILRRYGEQREAAYRDYVADMQKAWSGTENPDPQTMSAIALHILSTLNAC